MLGMNRVYYKCEQIEYKMGNQALPFNLKKRPSPSRYSYIDPKSNLQQSRDQSSLDQWDSSWKDVTHQNIYYRIQYGKLNTFRNQITSEEVQRYRVILNDKNDFEKWKQMVHWRNNSHHLPKIQHFSLQNKGEVCVSQFQINLFIERIPLRLIDLTDIPYPQNLYFLLSVLKGFKYIFFSPFPIKSFRVTESMICVNKEGQIKVWLNPNLSDFQPINQKNTTYATQEDILRSLIDLVQQNTDQRDYPYPFRQYLLDKNIPINGDYNSIIQQIYAYAKDMKVNVPKYAFSVRDILQKDFLNINKVDSENSFSHKPHFRHQNSSIGRDRSLSVLNSLDFQSCKKQQGENRKQGSKEEFFPKQKTHGLVSPKKFLANYNFQTIPKLSNLNHNHNQLSPLNHDNLMQIQKNRNLIPNQDYNHLINKEKVQQIYPNLSINTEVSHSLTDQHFLSNINGHLMKINKIGNNMVQYHQPYQIYQPPIHQPHFSPQKKQIQLIHSLEKPNKIHNNSMTHLPPPGYKIVQRKIVHLMGYNPSNHARISNFDTSYGSQMLPSENNTKPYQIPQNHCFKQIERVNSTKIPFPTAKYSQISEFTNRPQSMQKTSFLALTSTKRPELISSDVQIKRINRQICIKTLTSNENSQQSIRKTNSFKNNLIKSQHEDKQVDKTVGNVKYYTKKDSEQTLDPEIAGDLIKYLGQNS